MKAADYKGKWFILVDKYDHDDIPAHHINIEWAMTDGLREHVKNCIYYGIPAYVGSDAALHESIREIEKELSVNENI